MLSEPCSLLLCTGCMKMKPDHERVTKLLTDTVTLLCKNGLSYGRELRIQGLLGITVDSNDVFLVPINDSFSGSSSSGSPSVPSSVSDSAAAGSSQSRQRLDDDIVDLTRLVETPDIRTGVRSSHLPSSISPMHHGAPTRPRSAGGVISQTRSRAITPNSSNLTLSLTRHSQPVARQLPPATVAASGHYSASTSRRNSTERLMSANSQHSNALALVDSSAVHPGQRPHAGYVDSIQNLMLACERQLAARCCPRGQFHRQLPHAGTCAWTGTEQQHSMHQRQMHQSMTSVGGTAAEDPTAVGRLAAEHFSIPPHPGRHPVLPTVPGNVCVRRSEANPLHYMHTSTSVPGICPPPTLCRQPLPGVPRPAYPDYLRHVDNMHQAYAIADARQLVNNAEYFEPAAKRHAPNHLPRQAVQSFNPAFVQSQLPHPHGYLPHSQSTLFSQQTCSVADTQVVVSVPLSSVSPSQASCFTSSLVIKPPSSPVHSGRKSRSRHVEHIDLCGDDETADIEFDIPVASIVIQPDNTDLPIAADEAERSNISMSASDSCVSEYETTAETVLSENDLPPLSRIHEIVPIDDGLNNESDEFSVVRNMVVAENVGESAPESFSVALTSGLPVSGQSTASVHLDSELPSAPLDISGGLLSTFPENQIGIDSRVARLSADESRQMAELYFETEDNSQ